MSKDHQLSTPSKKKKKEKQTKKWKIEIENWAKKGLVQTGGLLHYGCFRGGKLTKGNLILVSKRNFHSHLN